jgi:hypothetical protein
VLPAIHDKITPVPGTRGRGRGVSYCAPRAVTVNRDSYPKASAISGGIVTHWKSAAFPRRTGIGDEAAVPILLSVDFDGRETGRQRTACHHVLRANFHFPAVEISKLAGFDVDGADAQTRLLSGIDAIEIDEPFPQRSLSKKR